MRPKSLDLPVDHFNYGGLCQRYISEYDAYMSDQIIHERSRIIHAFYDMIVKERQNVR